MVLCDHLIEVSANQLYKPLDVVGPYRSCCQISLMQKDNYGPLADSIIGKCRWQAECWNAVFDWESSAGCATLCSGLIARIHVRFLRSPPGLQI